MWTSFTAFIRRKADIILSYTFGGLCIMAVAISGLLISAVKGDFYFDWDPGFSWAESGQVGDFFGGVVGTLISLLGFILIYFSFKKQAETLDSQRIAIKNQDDQFEKSQIENRFIELIKLHKENLYDITYERGATKLKDRKAIDFIHNQFLTCYEEIAPFFKHVEVENIYLPGYLQKSRQINHFRTTIDLDQLAHIDIAYSIVFFGTSYNDLTSLLRIFSKTYRSNFISPIASFISLKPFNADFMENWVAIKKDPVSAAEGIVDITFKRKDSTYLEGLDEDQSPLEILVNERKYDKYYGGHQYKLGQYFRHLFQTVKYINEQPILGNREKYNYIKSLRAQLSTIEQYLIFCNSLSFMGRAWELEHVKNNANDEDLNCWLITKFNFIKNIPDISLGRNIKLRNYYPEVEFEFEDKPTSRNSLVKRFT